MSVPLKELKEMEPPIGLREEDNTTEPSESLKQRVKENQEKLKENKIDEEEIDNEYFSDLQEYINFRSEDYVEDNLTYPQFVSKHYPEPEVAINTYGDDDWATPSEKEITVDGGEIEVTVEPSEEQMKELEVHENKEPRIITSEEDLNEEELNELSREIGKTETIKEDMPINLTEEELQKLEEILNITYNDEDVPFDRITDTTKTFVDNSSINDDESDDEGRTLRYKGR
jgi:hypothetical protein